MKWFSRKEVYIGYDLNEYTRIMDALVSEGVEISSKMRTQSKRWTGIQKSTIDRSKLAVSKNKQYDVQYIIYVDEDDFETAEYICNKIMHG